MKYLVTLMVLFSLISQTAKANCDYTKIVDNGNGIYTYTAELNLCVGNMRKDLASANAQIADYQKAITFKDLALVESDKRVTLWQDSTFKLEDRISTIDSLEHKNNILYFVLGIAVTGAAVYGAGKLAHH